MLILLLGLFLFHCLGCPFEGSVNIYLCSPSPASLLCELASKWRFENGTEGWSCNGTSPSSDCCQWTGVDCFNNTAELSFYDSEAAGEIGLLANFTNLTSLCVANLQLLTPRTLVNTQHTGDMNFLNKLTRLTQLYGIMKNSSFC